MRREVRAVCDRSVGNCYINPSEPCYIVLTQRCFQNIKQRSCRICPIGFGRFCCHPILPWKITICCLRNYASLKCVAFPLITQIAVCCTPGMRRKPRTCTSGVVAVDTKRAAFQQLQGYIITRLYPSPVLYCTDKVFSSCQSDENITISRSALE